MRNTTVSTSARGPVPPREVWRRYAVVALWSSWAPHLTRVEASDEVIRPGTTGRVWALGVVPARFVVDVVDPAAMTWAWTVRCLGLTLCLHHTVLPGRGHGTRTALRIRGPWWAVMPYRPVAWWALRRLVRLPSVEGP